MRASDSSVRLYKKLGNKTEDFTEDQVSGNAEQKLKFEGGRPSEFGPVYQIEVHQPAVFPLPGGYKS